MAAYWYLAVAASVFVVIVVNQIGFFKRVNHFPIAGRTIVITGGSQGMGRGLAKLLAQRGANIVIVARDVNKLQAASEYIKKAAANPTLQKFHYISADVTKPEENTRIINEVTAWNDGQPPDIVWANAGMSVPGLFLDVPVETLRSQMDINYWAAAYLARATLKVWLKPPQFAKDKSGSTSMPTIPRHFIMTSSTLAFCGIAGYSAYSPAKAALRSLSDSLRSEINLYNGARKGHPSLCPPVDVQIHTVFPGTILSPGYETENKTKHPVTSILEEGDPAQTEDEVAAKAVDGLEKGRYLITTQFLGAAMRASALQGSPRNNWLTDTLFSWVTSIAWLFISPQMENTVSKWGQKYGMPRHG